MVHFCLRPLTASFYAALLSLVPLCCVSGFSAAPIYRYTHGVGARSNTASSYSTGSATEDEEEIHPAVLDWPDKYCSNEEECGLGPRVLHMEFTVEKGTDELVADVDAFNWPTWTTADKEKWAVGNQVKDKVMPYNELSYVLSGRLEIIPSGQAEVFIVEPGDFVTFPQGFTASWRVLEELTWHYFLY
jgi:hypothetical protein